ncbi:stimulus-sensing domain-containing protein [Dongia mobilis]|uniref:stimulus-sensing domain-containing protein n=1 Tax=Dongia sp. TaxID=1977262 RepID=UPI0026EEC40A
MSEASRSDEVERWRLPLSSARVETPDKGDASGFWRRRKAAAQQLKPARTEPELRPSVPLPRQEPALAPVKPAKATKEKAKSKRLPASRRSLWQSPLTRRILVLNIMALLVPVLGLLYLPTYRDSLLQSELELLKTEGSLFSGALAASGVATGPLGEEKLVPETSRQTIRRLVDVSKTRARLFTPDGTMVADSFLLSGPGGIVTITPLPPLDPNESLVWKWVAATYDWVFDRLPSSRILQPYQEAAVQNAADYQEVVKAMGGEAMTFVRDAGKGKMILSAAVPVQRYRQVLGALLLTKPGDDIEATLRDTRLTILGVSGIALGVTVLLSLYLASTIALPIHRLADAADRVRRDKGRQKTIPDLSARGDEIGDLSGALRDMTEAVWRRMDAIEGFAADVAHEIKNPLTSLRSAVETVARVEDPTQQKKLMSIILDDVQRLDRLISDISDASRIDAEMSRAEAAPVKLRDLVLAVADIHAATGRDSAPQIRTQLPEGGSLSVLGTEGRLGQVVRNLVANAISFSPPQGVILLAARRVGRHIQLTVEDEGPGIPPDKLGAIFERFYSERPKGEKFGTHSGLGLSISKQIVEAYGGSLRADNRVDAQGRILGARFTVTLLVA